jgi:tRNA(Arg) A34 adenosine deaminase TadA
MDAAGSDHEFLREAIRLSREGMAAGKGGPFGAVVVAAGKIVGRGSNLVLATGDPTAHAEVVAIREAARALGRYHLDGCDIYASCEPCPMCLGAIYWARIGKLVHAATQADAARIGFGDQFIYEEMARPSAARKLATRQILREEAIAVMDEWQRLATRQMY